ncbi:hypothetical protein BH24ACT11_BH24ACT11_18230 [soil metagenome]
MFITTKVPPGRADARATLQQGLDQVGCEHVDLWLIHWPSSDGLGFDAWHALIEATGVPPAVNQVEWGPLPFDRAVLDGHRERDVVLEGYSALRGGTLDHPEVVRIAERLGRSPAQVIVRWHLEHGVVVIPKSQQYARVVANADVGDFTLGADDVAALDALGSAGPA